MRDIAIFLCIVRRALLGEEGQVLRGITRYSGVAVDNLASR